MIRALDKVGPHWRALRRLKGRQVVERVRLRSRQARIRVLGVDRVLPRRRTRLAGDWAARVQRLRPPHAPAAPQPWAHTAGLRFLGNAGWLTNSAGRTLRHERDLARLELCYHEFIHGGTLPPDEAWEFVGGYLQTHRQRAGDGRHAWHPYAVSNRLASWLKFLALAVPTARPELPERLAHECLLLADFVAWMLERDLEANHLLKNLWSIAVCDLLLSPDPAQSDRSVRDYLAELDAQLLPDGGHYELSPMYHAKVLLDAREIERLAPPAGEAAARLRVLTTRATAWLEEMRLAPGGWANVNDSWTIPSLSHRVWPDQAWVATPGLRHLEPSGFVRGTRGGWQWLLDVGSVSPAFNPGHSHSDALSVLISHEGTPLILDPGVLHYSPNDERRFLKSCHAHNGPCLRERDHTELVGTFRVGHSGRATLEHARAEGVTQVAAASLEGYLGVRVRRGVTAQPGQFVIEDTWAPRGGGAFAPWSRFLWNARLSDVEDCRVEDHRLVLRFRIGPRAEPCVVTIHTSGAALPRLGVQESWYSDEFGKTLPAIETIVTAEKSRQPARVRTTVSVAG